MKINIKNLTLVFITSLMMMSCGDFFEESSQDEIKPSTTEDLAAVMYSAAYPYNFVSDDYLIMLTDEVQCNGVTYDNYKDRLRIGQPLFCFNNQMFDGYESFIDDENSWKNYYKLIMGCNVVLDNIDNMTGTDIVKNNITGQARLLRAFYYMKLAMIYCQPYSNNPDANLGLSLITKSNVEDERPSRSSLKQTYGFIEQELIEASSELYGFKPTTVYRVTKTVADVLLSRLYLYEEKWDKAIEYANIAIDEGPKLTSIANLVGKDISIYDYEGSTEVVWNYFGKVNNSSYIDSYNSYGYKQPYTLSTSVAQLYDATNDLRYKKYIIHNAYNGDYASKVNPNNRYNGEHGIRMAEAYLNRAEAYAHKFVAGESKALPLAISDLNELRVTRYAVGAYTPLDESIASDLLQNVLDERQREFVWEDGFRWMDIKRFGLSVTHTFIDEEGNSSIYTLKSNDPLYALPIPNDAISRNPNLQQNPR